MLACILLTLSLFFVRAWGDLINEKFTVDFGHLGAVFNPPEAWSTASASDIPCKFKGVGYATTTVGAGVEFNFTGGL